MRLIDADKLKYEAELCRETTDAFQELIDRQPDYYKPVPLLISSDWAEFRSHPDILRMQRKPKRTLVLERSRHKE